MTEQTTYPDPEQTLAATRNTAAAIRLHAAGHIDEATIMLWEAGPFVSTNLLAGLVVEFYRALGGDPKQLADRLILDAESKRIKLEEEGTNND